MTPTRALIEAIETYKKMMDTPGLKDIAVAHRLEAAISSAKAAEEGVELASKRCSCGRTEALATIPAVQGMDK